MYPLTCVPNEDSDHLASAQSDQCLHYANEETLHPWLSKNVPSEDSDLNAKMFRLI